jgi:hypothetical protein
MYIFYIVMLGVGLVSGLYYGTEQGTAYTERSAYCEGYPQGDGCGGGITDGR